MLAVSLLIRLFFGVVSAVIASNKGRNAAGWFFGGFFLGLIGLVIVAVLSNKKEEDAKWSEMNKERRRLREELRQERIKNEATRKHANRRLDAHDKALSMNTRSGEELPASEKQPGELESGDESPPPPPGDRWYYLIDGKQNGPVYGQTIRNMLRSGDLHGDSLLWREDLNDWQRAQSLYEFRSELSS